MLVGSAPRALFVNPLFQAHKCRFNHLTPKGEVYRSDQSRRCNGLAGRVLSTCVTAHAMCMSSIIVARAEP